MLNDLKCNSVFSLRIFKFAVSFARSGPVVSRNFVDGSGGPSLTTSHNSLFISVVPIFAARTHSSAHQRQLPVVMISGSKNQECSDSMLEFTLYSQVLLLWLFQLLRLHISVTVPSLASVYNEDALKSPYDRSIYLQGIEKKTARLKGSEKAVVGTAVANLLTGQPRVEKLSILPRSGGALAYIPPTSEDRYLLFINELLGRLVTLLGGRAAEEFVYSGRISTGAF